MVGTFIRDYRPVPGAMVEFRPTPATLEAATTAPVNSGPMSYVQENHLRRIRAHQRAGRPRSPWLGFAFDLPGRLDTRAMAAALDIWVDRHRSLLSWFSADATGALHRHSVGSVTMTPVDVETPDDIAEHLGRRFDEGTDPFQWPPFVVVAILRAESSTIHYAVDHTHTDGVSLMMVFSELRAIYRAVTTGTELTLPDAGSPVEAAAVERERAAELTLDSPELREWLDIWEPDRQPSFPLDVGVRPGRLYPSAVLHLDVFDPDEADRFSRMCKAHGAGFTAGWLTALAITNHQLTGQSRYTALTVVNARHEPRWQLTQGWFINLVPVAFDVTGQAFEAVLADAQHAFDRARRLAKVPIWRVAELLPRADPQRGSVEAVPASVSYLDFRHAPDAEEWTTANLTGLAGPNPIGDVSLWLNRQVGVTEIQTLYPDTGVAREPVERYVLHLRRVLRDMGNVQRPDRAAVYCGHGSSGRFPRLPAPPPFGPAGRGGDHGARRAHRHG